MGEFILEVAENQRHLCIQRGSVAIMDGKQILGSVPIDSLASVILSGDGISLSKHFLATMAEEGIPVTICDKQYLPVSMCLPYAKHYRTLAVAEKQLAASPVLKKQLWQVCVTAKITNQAQTLLLCHPEHPTAQKLTALARQVRSGDSDNKEGQAARLYWPALMGKGFLRDPDTGGINTLLNYGYAIVRAACARALCASGLLPLFGIHHRNAYNAFCLADDLMEPLRPFVDKLVVSLNAANLEQSRLVPAQKKRLAAIQRTPLPFCGEEHTLSSITQHMAQGLVRSFMEGKSCLRMPG